MAEEKHISNYKNPVINWIDTRLPIFSMMDKEYGKFPTPKNFNYFWNFGAILMVILGVMILSGLFLAMHYTPHVDHAFDSVERIMRDVNYGWLIRYVHANGASMFFVAVYIHIFRGMYYGSYKSPREILWITGVILFLLMMATAFMGYVLPWGQMSFWGATVITNLFSVFPLVGEGIVTWLWGGFSVDNPTLNRFFALHFLLPFVIAAVVFLHVWALHIAGSNNPSGVEPITKKDTVPFHPYYTAKDLFGLLMFLIIFGVFVFFAPNMLGHPDNYIPADPLVTPAHIVPEWYFLPFYAILRCIPSKLIGVLAMFGSILIWFILPWLDRSPIRSARYRPLARLSILFMVTCFLLLGVAGGKSADAVLHIGPVELAWVWIARLAALYYFAHFLVILPLLPKIEKTKTLPKSIDASIKKAALVLGLLLLPVAASNPVHAAGEATPLPEVEFQHEGPFGTFDYSAVQRGFKVYKNVCATCHGMKHLSYRHLMDIGFTEDQVKAIALEYTVTDGPNDEGEMFERPAIPSDSFYSPFPNDKAAAAANNGAVPPDLSLMAKARPGGADYIYALLTGYEEPPEGKELLPGQYYNVYFPGHVLSMAPPLIEGIVSYDDGTEATTEQMAHDVSAFLMWGAEPKMEQRKRMGLKVLLYLVVFAGIMYGVKRKVWKDVK